MSDVLQTAEIRALIGDAAHANMLLALGDGRALPAGELAYAARSSRRRQAATWRGWSGQGCCPW